MGTSAWDIPTLSEYWRWRFGIPSPIWIRNVAAIRQLIDKQRLQPIAEQQLAAPMQQPYMMHAEPEVKGKEAAALRPRPFPGGLRFAHVHYEGRVYALDREQWDEFSGRVLEGFRQHLQRAKTVSFTQLVELSDVIDSM